MVCSADMLSTSEEDSPITAPVRVNCLVAMGFLDLVGTLGMLQSRSARGLGVATMLYNLYHTSGVEPGVPEV